MPIERPFWLQRLQEAWKVKSIVWLSGVRRSGKTTLAQLLPQTEYFNCDLPSTQRLLEDPETFFSSMQAKTVVLDEVHQLSQPSQVLKIAADHFPNLRILATGSSTLSATRKFKDALTDRKRTVHLVPILPEELESFGVKDLKMRLFAGGLPPALLKEGKDPEFFGDWIDSFYARDVQELFRIEKRQPFIQLLEILLRQNAGLAEVLQIAKQSGLSRPTVIKYLEILETTWAITVIRPFHAGGRQEILQQPRIYGFDTGFVCHARGWKDLRPEDCGHLLENLTLESLQAIPLSGPIHFWRTKQQKEIDFVIPITREKVHAIECKWKSGEFEIDNLKKFREDYPIGDNFVVCADAPNSYSRMIGKLRIHYVDIRNLRKIFKL